MKKLLLAVAAVMISVSTFAQGQLVFVNRVAGVFDSPITITPGGAPGGSIPGLVAELHLLSGGGASVTPGLLGTTTFRIPEAQQAYLLPATITINGYTDGAQGPLQLQVRVFSGETLLGQSLAFEATPGVSPNPPANMNSLAAFTIVPEPTTMVLGLLGAAALLFRRRK